MALNPTQSQAKRPQGGAYHPLLIVLVAACGGIAADRVCGLPVAAWATTAGAAWGAWLVLWRFKWDRVAGVVLLASVAASAGLWHHLHWNRFARDDVGSYARAASQPVCVEAIARKGPRRVPAPPYNPMRIIPRYDRTQVEVRVVGIRDGARWRAASGRARLTVDGHLLGVRAGDRLRIFGHLSAPQPAHNPGDFDYAAHARADRKLGQLRSDYPDCVTVVRRGPFLSPARWIDNARTAGRQLLRRYLDERQSALAAAVLLGVREDVTGRQWQAFVQTGTVHLLAISGLHVGIVAGTLLLGLRLFLVRRSRAVAIVAAATVLYAVLTDARPPAIRATILVLVMCGSTYLGRPQSAFNALAAAALVVLAMNPADLFSTGVHLSFITVTGLMWFAPGWFATDPERDRLYRLLAEGRGWLSRTAWAWWRSLRLLTLIGVLMWLLTLPLVTAQFHVFAPAAGLLNAVLWIPMAFALVSGFGVLVFGWLLPPLAVVCGWCCNGSLWLLDWCVRWVGDLPFTHFWVPGSADWWVLGVYGGLAVLAAFAALRPPRRWCVAILALWIAVGFAPWALRSRAGRLQCTFLSLGHGCSVLVELPSGQTMLYDAGQFASPEFGARSVAASLWSRGITHLDAVVVSHADADHYNLLPQLLERFSVGVVYVSPVMFDEENRALAALRQAIREAEVPVGEIFANDRLEGGEGCGIEVMHPPSRGVLGNDNANSIVLAIEYEGRRILLPGDLESPGLDDVLAEAPWDCDVLLAPHHGSRRSNPPGLAAWCSPEWVIVSGSLNDYDPETEATYRGAGGQLLHTGRIGAVQVVVEQGGLEVESFLNRR